MFRRALACTLLILASAALIGLRAETFPYDHMHLNAADPATAVAWYVKNLGAKNGAAADRVVFGRTNLCLRQARERAAERRRCDRPYRHVRRRRRGHAQPPVHRFSDVLGNREAQAGPLNPGREHSGTAVEGPEDMSELGRAMPMPRSETAI